MGEVVKASPNPLGRRGLWSKAKGKRAAELLSVGMKQAAVAEDIGVSVSTMRSWLVTRPEFREMVDNHREARAMAMELITSERAMQAVEGGMDAAQVKAFDAGAKHVRWASSKLNPSRYGEPKQIGNAVQIVISTTAFSAPETGEQETFHLEVPDHRGVQDAEFEEGDQ
jgi:Bacteriophage Sf6, terminase small subunit-like